LTGAIDIRIDSDGFAVTCLAASNRSLLLLCHPNAKAADLVFIEPAPCRQDPNPTDNYPCFSEPSLDLSGRSGEGIHPTCLFLLNGWPQAARSCAMDRHFLCDGRTATMRKGSGTSQSHFPARLAGSPANLDM
jgi:hypothetical protein